MTAAILVLAAAVLCLAVAVLLAAWWHLGRSWPDTLDDTQIRENLAPLVATELTIMAAQDTDPPIEDWTS